MSDFIVALGLVFFIEGVVFLAFPGTAKRAMASVLQSPDHSLRAVGVVSAVIGIVLIWLIRG
ncbi:MAG TPA: DUF2065 domain-containing protein [Xanthobacteraceae bacterium]|nr:DUF2065 domain-containing protein [Xanthobacteraceae bacterium]